MTAEYKIIGDVAVITMTNPPVNGLGLSTRVGITDGLTKANADPAVKSMLVDYQKVMKVPAPDNTLLYTAAAATRMVLKAITAAGTDADATKVAAALRGLPAEDPYLGKGVWAGKASFGLAQELVFPVGMGLVADGKHLGVSRLDLSGTK
jgi:branched-chain amino acid transport system substrate-binding protein